MRNREEDEEEEEKIEEKNLLNEKFTPYKILMCNAHVKDGQIPPLKWWPGLLRTLK